MLLKKITKQPTKAINTRIISRRKKEKRNKS